VTKEFGKLLRFYRRQSTDPERGGNLTQERLAEFIGRYLNDAGPVAATVSNWEQGHSSINQNDRDILLALVQALHQCQGIQTPEQADQLLHLGGYRALDEAERPQVDPTWLPPAADRPTAPPTLQNWQPLQRYLPYSLYQTVEMAATEAETAVCLPHLRQLLQTAVSYVPRHLALALLQQPLPPEQQIGGHFLAGTLLFADISGFTHLTELLRERAGKGGAEEVVRIVNEFLEAMLGILFRHDGRLIRFGGDALLGLFTGPADGAMDAVWAAWEMKQMMAEHFDHLDVLQEVIPLAIRMGHHTGMLFAASAGTAEHMEYILTGPVVEYTAQAEAVAQRGDIVVSAETYRLVQSQVTAEPLPQDNHFYRVLAVARKQTAALTNSWVQVLALLNALQNDLWGLVARLDALTPYLPTGVLPQLVYDPRQEDIEGQYRQVTVLFANFVGMSQVINAYGPDDPAGIAADLNEYFQAMQEEVAYYGGAVNKVDLYDQGDKLLVTFGAPVAHERDARRAALTALAMQQAMTRLTSPAVASFLSQRIGIHTGFTFAGSVGSAANHQREYTVMGDTVNLAARLMAAAPPGEIWLSPSFTS
jgi:class 3 adenylate cyclase